MSERTAAELREEVQRLEERLEKQARTIRTLQARERDCQQLLSHTRTHLFAITSSEGHEFDAGDFAGEEQGLLGASWPPFLSPERAAAEQHRTLETGAPVTYKETAVAGEGRQTWRVVLIPQQEKEGPRGVLGSVYEVPTEDEEDEDSGALYHQLVGLLPDAVVICGADARLRYVNAAGVRMLGAEAAGELLGRPVWDFVPENEQAEWKVRQQRLREGQRVEYFEHHLRRLDGAPVPVETASVPIEYQGERAVLINARDLRARRKVERSLSETQDLFYKAFHTGPAALAIADAKDGAYIDVNERFERLTGYAREELVGRSSADLGLWVSPQAREAVLQTVLEEGRVRDMEVRLRVKDGSVRHVVTSAQRIEVGGEACLLTSTFDITRRRQAQEAERESRALLYKVFHASPAAISIARISDGCFIDVNDEACQLYGYSREEIVGQSSRELELWVHPERREVLVEALRDRGAVHDFEMSLRARSGQVINALYSFQRIQVKGEACLLAVGVDISKRKQTEEVLRQAKARAEEAARFRTGILTNMTHEVRTPLTVILGFTSMLRQGVRPKYARFVDLVERSGRRLLLTLDSILDLAQLEAGTLSVETTPHNVLDAASSAAASLRPIVESRGLDFRLELPAQPAYAALDFDVFTRALSHLVDNASKFTEEGSVTLRVRPLAEEVAIDIEDTGIGIEEKFLPHLFDSFAQESGGLARTHQGSGLGLTVSSRFVEKLGGTLQVQSEKGQGSTFTVLLPRLERGAASS